MGCQDKYNTILDLDQIVFATFEDFINHYKINIVFKGNIKHELFYKDFKTASDDYNKILKYMTANEYLMY